MKKEDILKSVIDTLFNIDTKAKKITLTIPATVDGRKKTISVELDNFAIREIRMFIRRAVNKAQIAQGLPVIFSEPIDHPDFQQELINESERILNDLLVEVRSLENTDEKIAKIKTIKEGLNATKPDIRMSGNDFNKILRFVQKLSPSLTREDVISALS